MLAVTFKVSVMGFVNVTQFIQVNLLPHTFWYTSLNYFFHTEPNDKPMALYKHLVHYISSLFTFIAASDVTSDLVDSHI